MSVRAGLQVSREACKHGEPMSFDGFMQLLARYKERGVQKERVLALQDALGL